MRRDRFSAAHPAVSFLFFVGAILLSGLLQHPAYVLAGMLCSGLYYCLLNGRKSWKRIFWLFLLFLLLSLGNPLLNHQGNTALGHIFGNPYTLESLLYGASLAGVLVSVLLWAGCYNTVMTSDKFTMLFGSLAPALSLLLVMVLRLIPGYFRKMRQITGSRESIGKGSRTDTYAHRLTEGATVLSAMTSWALESGVTTADSMRGRGYGTARRTDFQHRGLRSWDWALLLFELILLLGVATTMARGGTAAVFTPEANYAPMTGWNVPGFAAYVLFLLLPSVLTVQEMIQWQISRSRI